jgi:hypothetical protein
MSAADVVLAEGESLVSDQNEIIYRQVTTHMMTPEGQLGSHAFGAASSDRGMPSYARSSKVSAQDARDWHNEKANSPSLGVWGLSVEEVAQTRRVVIDDSDVDLPEGSIRAPGHCFIDYRGLSPAQVKSIRAVLLLAALQRQEIPTDSPLDDGQLFL